MKNNINSSKGGINEIPMNKRPDPPMAQSSNKMKTQFDEIKRLKSENKKLKRRIKRFESQSVSESEENNRLTENQIQIGGLATRYGYNDGYDASGDPRYLGDR